MMQRSQRGMSSAATSMARDSRSASNCATWSPAKPHSLINHEHLAVNTPYRSRHAIYVREGATQAAEFRNEIPDMLLRRKMLSLRAFDGSGMMVEADLCAGDAIEALIERMLAREHVAYLHAHSASHGCYLAVIERDR